MDVISFNATLSACERASQWHFALHLLTLFDAKNDELEAGEQLLATGRPGWPGGLSVASDQGPMCSARPGLNRMFGE